MGNVETKDVQRPMTDVVATEPRFVFNQEITLVLKEHLISLSDDDFSICDVNGQAYFKCRGKTFSIRDKKIIYDLYNKPILNIRHKIMSLVKNIKIYEGSEDSRMLAKAAAKSIFSMKKLTVEFYNRATERNEVLEIKCNLIAFDCNIYHGKHKEGAPLIAKISKKVDLKLLATTKENYLIRIAPGVDAAFMVALAIVFDEFRNDSDE